MHYSYTTLNKKSSNTFFIKVLELFKCSPAVANLRIFFEIKWPIRVLNRGSKGNQLEIDWSKFREIYPFLANANFCKPVNSVNPPKSTSQKNTRERQAKLYRKLLDSGKVKNRAELARKFGVSRAWITKVLGN